jgi:hypothetical protein
LRRLWVLALELQGTADSLGCWTADSIGSCTAESIGSWTADSIDGWMAGVLLGPLQEIQAIKRQKIFVTPSAFKC